MPQSNELRVFISSTFRDLQEEREHLVKKIFPEIRALCRERGVAFTDIDLRWGLTQEEAVLGRVIRTCLEEVDKCRPYFIGMIGNRYGWAPELHEVLIDPDLLAKYPWIEELTIEGASVTEMEFVHGVFNAPRVEGEYAFFYHRAADLSQADNPERLQALIERVRSTDRPLREFSTVEELGQAVRNDLVMMIDSYWPVQEAPSELELERRSHRAFASNRVRAYIPNPTHLKEFTHWLAEGTTPLVIRGESGYGKSSLVAYLVEYYRKKHPTALVIEHYVGASRTSGSALAVMRHIIDSIRERFSLEDPPPTKPEDLERSFANWLFRCEHLAGQEGIGAMIVIDAVNQLDDAGRRLGWLPKILPEGVRLVVSTTRGESDERLAERGWSNLMVGPVEDERVRQSIVLRYLGEFHKGIAPEQLQRVTSDSKGASPLYLRVVAEELRLHGEHETLDGKIDRYEHAEDLLGVFDLMLERIEADHGTVLVTNLMRALLVSRSGLSEQEMLDITGISRLQLSRLLFAIDYHFVHRDGLLGFFHEYLRRAVEQRYMPEEQDRIDMHRRLAEYFARQTPTLRVARELLWQYARTGDDTGLVDALGRIDLVRLLWNGGDMYEVLGQWSRLVSAGNDPEAVYRDGLGRYLGNAPDSEHVKGLETIGRVLERLGRWSGAVDAFEQMLAVANRLDDRSGRAHAERFVGWMKVQRGELEEAVQRLEHARSLFEEIDDRSGASVAFSSMGTLYWRRGEYDRALECFHRSLTIAEELGYHGSTTATLGNMGIVYYERGEYDKVMECWNRALTMTEESGDRHGYSLCIGNMGNVYYQCSEFDRALECYQRQLEIAEEIGDLNSIALAMGNIGGLYSRRGEYELALECHQRRLAIAQELGDRHGESAAVGGMGLVYSNRGENDRALECYQRQLTLAEELGDPQGVWIAVGNMGSAFADLGESGRALECYDNALREHRTMGYRYGMSYWLAGRAGLLLEHIEREEIPENMLERLHDIAPENRRAAVIRDVRESIEECRTISVELSKPDTLFQCRVLLARADAVEGSIDRAVEQLSALLDDADDDGSRGELYYWLWRLGSRENEEHRVAALRLYESLLATSSRLSYHKRIEELALP